MKVIKRTGQNMAVLLAVMAGTGSVHAFTIDNSQQRITNIQPAQLTTDQTVYVQPSAELKTTTNVSIQAATPAPTPAATVSTQVNVYSAPVVNPQVQTTNYAANSAAYSNSNYASSFDELALTTRSAAVLVYDLQTGKPIYTKNINAQRSIASVSKVMTAMVTLDADLDMREEITLIASDLVGAKQASTRLKAGDRMTRSEFTLMALMRSENPAAKALARTYPGGYDAFIAAMNQKAQELGMYQTKFSDSSGLDPRNMSSANDLLIMMKAVNSDPRYHSIRNFSTAPTYDFYITNYNSGDRVYKGNNTNRLVREGTYPIGVQKTGYIRESGYNVVMETNINNRPAIVVLLGASNSENRWRDAENILTELAYRK
ncbi:D-alanyl-D-alanine carboxypeptidase family protein [Moraxella sp. ZJ142]|uniref:D-alanyl-D-alanine carboxypeptidase family protein n=1 Tax=Moraxella marmotae TaxID=3344520 RepID=UPI0035D4708A